MDLIEGTPFPNIYQEPECSDCLFQGDIIKRVVGACDLELCSIGFDPLGYLIVTNSCDLQRNEKKFISYVPIYSFDLIHTKFIEASLRKAIAKEKREQALGKSINFEDEFANFISQMIQDESNYNKKLTFFLSPLETFSELPTIALIESIESISIKQKQLLLKHRVTSLKGPWREKLGFLVGYLFNRVATHTPETKDVKTWCTSEFEKEYAVAIKHVKAPVTQPHS